MKTLGERLKEIRDLRGFPQKQVAAVLGLQRPNYSKIENNHQNMSHKQLKMFCEFCDVSADYLLGISVNSKKTIPESTIDDLTERLEYIKDAINQ
jgi:transcriptional regulator with XRE-family HTH domain